MTTGAAGVQASQLKQQRWFVAAGRAGFAVSGLVQILIGLAALQIALRQPGSGQADQSGAFRDLAASPFGAVLLWVAFAGSAALALWLVVAAVAERGPDAKEVWGHRLKNLGKALVYGFLAVTALTFALGGSSDSADQQRNATSWLLEAPGGRVLLGLAAAVVLGIGVFLIYRGATRKFTEDLDLPAGQAGRATVAFGVVGYVARGLALIGVGVLLGIAAVQADASEATGLDGALRAFAELPAGRVVLGAIGVGWIASGVYGFIRAARDRMR